MSQISDLHFLPFRESRAGASPSCSRSLSCWHCHRVCSVRGTSARQTNPATLPKGQMANLYCFRHALLSLLRDCEQPLYCSLLRAPAHSARCSWSPSFQADVIQPPCFQLYEARLSQNRDLLFAARLALKRPPACRSLLAASRAASFAVFAFRFLLGRPVLFLVRYQRSYIAFS